MEPDSLVLLTLLLLGAVALLWVVARRGRVLVPLVAGAVSIALASAAGMALVNDYYGYYQTWGQLSADLTGSYGAFTSTVVSNRAIATVDRGALRSVTLPGSRSGISRTALVYLPPQYFQPRYATTRFPVVELVHGTPGSPSAWTVHLDVASIADQLISRHEMGPTILVMPTMSVGRDFQECVDAPGALDDTYLVHDVRTDVLARFRASSDPAQWGIAGYSSGGYCAANLALRHPAMFGASGIMDGYFRPVDGPAAAALHHDAAAEAANDPLRLAAALPAGASPLPAFWLSAGTGNSLDIRGARAFVAALHGVEQVSLHDEPAAGHNFYAWQAAVPHLLAWMWKQLAPPDLRVAFPVAGPVQYTAILPHNPAARHRPRHHATAHRIVSHRTTRLTHRHVATGPRR